ncbi:MAG: 1,4-dihydroxy-2-naphthoate polyprenyltransferase [Propionibacteriaceae bacterium]|jgi:1,4-dihydroxy-2-naphthoate octaprenyltransferase|nr:1,4-dihydroxy-2-naphthoate polyprenyltransferase [Propionibacteriaceae bacterium]
MASISEWVEGARLRTLPASIAPVVAGAAEAWFLPSITSLHADPSGAMTSRSLVLPLLQTIGCLLVALALQIGSNFANDYSDGIRGTDADRVGPMRLVGSGAASPRQVKLAAFASFGVAALIGLLLVISSGHWWLLIAGAACVAAAWFYTGGPKPYGYAGLGEVFVFVFFGLVATMGTVYVVAGRVTIVSLLLGVAMGALATAILVANNLRDIDTDRASGKRTLMTRLGDRRSRLLYVALVVLGAFCLVVAVIVAFLHPLPGASLPWLPLLGLLGLLGWILLIRPCQRVLSGLSGFPLVGVLKRTGQAELLAAVGLALGWLIAFFLAR